MLHISTGNPDRDTVRAMLCEAPGAKARTLEALALRNHGTAKGDDMAARARYYRAIETASLDAESAAFFSSLNA